MDERLFRLLREFTPEFADEGPSEDLLRLLAQAELRRLEVVRRKRLWRLRLVVPAFPPVAPYLTWGRTFAARLRDRAGLRLDLHPEYLKPFDPASFVAEVARELREWAAATEDLAAYADGFRLAFDGRAGVLVVHFSTAAGLPSEAGIEELAAYVRWLFGLPVRKVLPVDDGSQAGDAPTHGGGDLFSAGGEGGERCVRPVRKRPSEANHGVPLLAIEELTEDMPRVAVEGTIFAVETRPVKSGGTRYVFKITDGTDSIAVKVFPRDEAEEERFQNLGPGAAIRAEGNVHYDTYDQDFVLSARKVEAIERPKRLDLAPVRRVELHLHTAMSAMDAPLKVADAVRRAAEWGHGALAITDHAVVQAFPEAYELGKALGVKVIYGLEAYLVDDAVPIVHDPEPRDLLEDTYVVFDVETTGLSSEFDALIEIAAVKFRGGEVVETFRTFVDPKRPLPPKIVALTGIRDEDLVGAPSEREAVHAFLEFAQDATLVAHNARFDVGFLQAALRRMGLPPLKRPVVDSLELARLLLPNHRNHRLDTLAETYGVALERHHRALDDAAATAQVFWRLVEQVVEERGVRTQDALARLANARGAGASRARPYHATLLATSEEGLRNLYRLVTLSHTEYFYRVPRIPKSVLEAHREGLLVGSGCEEGEVFEAALNKGPDVLRGILEFYDYVELLPPDLYLAQVEDLTEDRLREVFSKLLTLARELGKPVVAVGNVHHLEPEDIVFRKVLLVNQNGIPTKDPERIGSAYYRTTEEMLDAFRPYVGELAEEIVIHAPRRIAESIPELRPYPEGLHTPDLPGAEEELRELAYREARRRYGDPLPELVAARLERELTSIVRGGYAVVYMSAQRVVQKSLADGYLVGSRGSVGSSLVAHLIGITEVNPLPPHKVCPRCHYFELVPPGKVGSGFDLPPEACPRCGAPLHRDGHDIPFETFMGFEGDKVPDIDLNFSGEYQAQAHRYVEELFGPAYVFRAGTISTVAERTAFSFARTYGEKTGRRLRKAELERLAQGIIGVKRTTGQHPGGLIIVPRTRDVHEFTPVQHPADDPSSGVRTTHFDYNALSDHLLKLDILGHDDPTILRMLQDFTGVDPRSVPVTDPEVLALFRGTEVLGPDVALEVIDVRTGTLGIPEFGTPFVRQMLEETRPASFAELVQISGLSHGTDVWLGNARDVIQSGEATLRDVIGCRDDVLVDLTHKGILPQRAFKIMEQVRKGKGLTPDDEALMREHGVPEWYIRSCNKIKYLFPKAHAVAYVLMALRIAYFKVYYPAAFYAAILTTHAADLDLPLALQGRDVVRQRILDLKAKGNDLTAKERSALTALELVYEMLGRGIGLLPVDLEHSDARRFLPLEDKLLPPLTAVPGLGLAQAEKVVRARSERPFSSLADLKERTGLSRNVVDALAQLGSLDLLPETDQLTLF
ncbi:PolC-type DNA polymerase III [Brockia lithotrophica]|uniref:DNA polymerase III PolC-type n=1 Tax=Brockia lithotrophica TaxID=933949 RepID=A0A660KTY5_9BACL|nr:PolC-type DNA polymerase III [Brockia lithotrophica]RKQ84226.1 DNA polymerase-3 subunit alpha (Gram-positive type) [Brockia lithotrophica]